MVRAVETASLIKHAMESPAPLFQLPEIREQGGPPLDKKARDQLETRFLDDVRSQFPGVNIKDPLVQAIAFPDIQDKIEKEIGGETQESMQARLTRALSELIKDGDGDILMVTHSALIGSLVAMLTGVRVNPVKRSKQGYNNCTITVIEVDEDKKMKLIFMPSA
jgi:broad specificity phosphatase PhoE